MMRRVNQIGPVHRRVPARGHERRVTVAVVRAPDGGGEAQDEEDISVLLAPEQEGRSSQRRRV